MNKKRHFKVGDKVKWNDPCIYEYDEKDREHILNRIFEIFKINGEVISISDTDKDSICEVEVFENELVKI